MFLGWFAWDYSEPRLTGASTGDGMTNLSVLTAKGFAKFHEEQV